MSEAKLAKQREYLAPLITYTDVIIASSVRTLRSVCHPETDQCEQILLKCRQALIDVPSSKGELKQLRAEIEETASYMCHLFMESFMRDFPNGTDDNYNDNVSQATLDYQKKLAKSFEAKQKNAPGFDGVGGGASRRTN